MVRLSNSQIVFAVTISFLTICVALVAPALFATIPGPVLLWLIRNRFPLSIASPIWLAVASITLSAWVGVIIYGNTIFTEYSLFVITTELTSQAVLMLGVGSLCMAIGAYLFSLVVAYDQPAANLTLARSTWKLASGIFLTFIALSVVLAIIYSGPIWDRDQYLIGGAGSPAAAIGPVLLFSLVGLAFFARTEEGLVPYLCVFFSLLFIIVLFSSGSRTFAMFPLALGLGAYISDRNAFGRWSLLLSVPVSILLLPIPFDLRGLDQHGLSQYIAHIPEMSYSSGDVVIVMSNLSIAVPITGLTAIESSKIPFDHLAISVNPLPGSIAGWYDIEPTMRYSEVFPFNAYGILWNQGAIVALPSFLFLGALFGYFDYRIRELAYRKFILAALVILLLCIFAILFLSSYSLRTGTRWLWYALIFDLSIRLIPRVKALIRGF